MPRADPQGMSVRELRQELQQRGIDFSDCIERVELAARLEQSYNELAQARAVAPTPPGTQSNSGRLRSSLRGRSGRNASRAKPLLDPSERADLESRWGAAFRSVEAEAAAVYASLDTGGASVSSSTDSSSRDNRHVSIGMGHGANDGLLDKAEFSAALGIMGASGQQLAGFMFDAIDVDRSGAISFFEFVSWMLTMTRGSAEDKLRFGYNLMDADKDGAVTKDEVRALLRSMMQVLAGLSVSGGVSSVSDGIPASNGASCAAVSRALTVDAEVDYFVETLFNAYDINGNGCISWEEYRRGCLTDANVEALRTLRLDAMRKGGAGVLNDREAAFVSSAVEDDEQCASAAKSGVKMGTRLFFGQSRFSFMLSVMVGLQMAVEAGAAEAADAEAHLSGADAADTATSTIDGNQGFRSGLGPTAPATSATPSVHIDDRCSGRDRDGDVEALPKTKFVLPTDASYGKSSFTGYDVRTFRAIRQAFGVSDDEFLGSLGVRQVLGSLLMGDIAGLSEMVSEGKSGSLFYWSHDGRFLVKTIGVEESEALRRMAPRYLAHVQEHPHTLLTRTLGSYKLRLQRAGLKKDEVYYLVVMETVFRTPCVIHERFDLKGSTYKRTVGPELRGKRGLVHKDLDWVEMGRSIRLRPELAAALRMQIKADAEFLALENIIDYSLLVGVHNVGGRRKQREWQRARLPELTALHEQFARACQTCSRECNTTSKRHGAPLFGNMDFDAFCDLAYEYTEHKAGTEVGAEVFTDKDSAVAEEACDISARSDVNPFTRSCGGIEPIASSGESDTFVFVGIIDTLIPFQLRKKTEHVAKRVILGKGANFSVVPPAEYKERFVEFMCSRVVSTADVFAESGANISTGTGAGAAAGSKLDPSDACCGSDRKGGRVV